MRKPEWTYCLRFTHEACGRAVVAAVADGPEMPGRRSPCGHCGESHPGRLVSLSHALSSRTSQVRYSCGVCGAINEEAFVGIAPMCCASECDACGAAHVLESAPLAG